MSKNHISEVDDIARRLSRLTDSVDGDYYYELRKDNMPKSHRSKDLGTQHIYAEFVNDKLESVS